MGEKIWNCPRCGPVDGPLYGDDQQFHCSSLDCDLVVHVLAEAERNPPKRDPKKYTQGATTSHPKRKKLSFDDKESRERGRAVLATIETRRRRREGLPAKRRRRRKTKERRRVSTEGKATEDEDKKKDQRSQEARMGFCDSCHEERWLLRKNPPTCSSCWHKQNPDHARSARAAKAAKTVKAKKRRGKKGQGKKLDADEALDEEVEAMRAVGAALADLPVPAIDRVLRWAVRRYLPLAAPTVSVEEEREARGEAETAQ